MLDNVDNILRSDSSSSACLFTGAPLSMNEKFEHAIPKKLGGRIKSRKLTSGDFNNLCGSGIDANLTDSYWCLMSMLGYLLPASAVVGERRVRLENSSDEYVVDGRAVLHPGGVKITESDVNGRPKAAAGPSNTDTVKKILEQNCPSGSKIEYGYSPPEQAFAIMPRAELLSPLTEIAVLKAGLLTMDHFSDCKAIHSMSGIPFTRSTELESCRQLVSNAAKDMRSADLSGSEKVLKGLQYEKMDQIRYLRKLVEHEASEFEHFVIVSANVSTRTLDMVVCLFGFDCYGFRLSENWFGSGFTALVVNGVLRGTTVSDLKVLPGGEYLCCSSDVCSFQHRARAPGEQLAYLDWMVKIRTEALSKALYKVIFEADAFLRQCLMYSCLPVQGEKGDLKSAIEMLFESMYSERIEEVECKRAFQNALNHIVKTIPANIYDQVASLGDDLSTVDWRPVIDAIREEIKKLTPEIGPPGEFRHTAGIADSR